MSASALGSGHSYKTHIEGKQKSFLGVWFFFHLKHLPFKAAIAELQSNNRQMEIILLYITAFFFSLVSNRKSVNLTSPLITFAHQKHVFSCLFAFCPI